MWHTVRHRRHYHYPLLFTACTFSSSTPTVLIASLFHSIPTATRHFSPPFATLTMSGTMSDALRKLVDNTIRALRLSLQREGLATGKLVLVPSEKNYAFVGISLTLPGGDTWGLHADSDSADHLVPTASTEHGKGVDRTLWELQGAVTFTKTAQNGETTHGKTRYVQRSMSVECMIANECATHY